MGEKSKISWCDGTFNPWIGCTQISTGCRHCYAETQNARFQWGGGWGKDQPRKRTSAENWKKPLRWAEQAQRDGVIRRVCCSSLADVFDEEVPAEWRTDLWELIAATAKIGGLEWLLLTKRPKNVMRMLPVNWLYSKPDYIRIGVTAEDQEMADERIPVLLQAWSGKNFLSCEPLLDLIDISYYLSGCPEQVSSRHFVTREMAMDACDMALAGLLWSDEEWEQTTPTIDWVICGGESGPGCRAMNLQWARSLRDQCQAARVPFFFKQVGGHPVKHDEPAGWPEDLRIQEFPS